MTPSEVSQQSPAVSLEVVPISDGTTHHFPISLGISIGALWFPSALNSSVRCKRLTRSCSPSNVFTVDEDQGVKVFTHSSVVRIEECLTYSNTLLCSSRCRRPMPSCIDNENAMLKARSTMVSRERCLVPHFVTETSRKIFFCP